jgi:hypothetical protein
MRPKKGLSFPLVFVLFVADAALAFELRVMKVRIADEESAGMDGDSFFKPGGQLRLKICSEETVK